MGLFDKLFKSRVTVINSETEPTYNQQVQTVMQPQPQPITPTGDFKMVVEDVFTITGRGTVVTGRVESGSVSLNDTVILNGTTPLVVAGVEMFRKMLDSAQAGDNVGLLLRDITRDNVKTGDVLTK